MELHKSNTKLNVSSSETGEDMARRLISLQTDLVSRQTFRNKMLHILDLPFDEISSLWEYSVAQARRGLVRLSRSSNSYFFSWILANTQEIQLPRYSPGSPVDSGRLDDRIFLPRPWNLVHTHYRQNWLVKHTNQTFVMICILSTVINC